MKFNIEIGIQKRPIKTVIMGCEGIGKWDKSFKY